MTIPLIHERRCSRVLPKPTRRIAWRFRTRKSSLKPSSYSKPALPSRHGDAGATACTRPVFNASAGGDVGAALDSDGMGYGESAALKAPLARHCLETYGVTVDPEQFILTCGASPALVLALVSQFAAGDRVALARPGYVAYRNTLRALHMEHFEGARHLEGK